jgi:hypothetical protein
VNGQVVVSAPWAWLIALRSRPVVCEQALNQAGHVSAMMAAGDRSRPEAKKTPRHSNILAWTGSAVGNGHAPFGLRAFRTWWEGCPLGPCPLDPRSSWFAPPSGGYMVFLFQTSDSGFQTVEFSSVLCESLFEFSHMVFQGTIRFCMICRQVTCNDRGYRWMFIKISTGIIFHHLM